MQWNRTDIQQQQPSLFTDVDTMPNSVTQDNTDTQEFSLESIQQRLGILSEVEEQNVVASNDLMPSEQTLRMSYQREYTANEGAKISKLSTKNKIAIASYAIVVLALIIAVTVCSVYVSGAFSSAMVLNAEYSEATATMQDLIAQTQEEDFDELAQRAAELGYIDAANSNTMEYTELETRPAQNFHVESNWFDSLCDWLSGVFGG